MNDISMLNIEVFKQAVMESRDGITVTDATKNDHPLIFVNPAFELMTGYAFEDIVNKNCRFLQADDNDQIEIGIIHESLRDSNGCVVTLRNYRKDGSMFWNEVSISTVYNPEGVLTHYIGVQKDVTTKVLCAEQLANKNIQVKEINQKLESLINIDSLTSVYNRSYFDQQLVALWRMTQRNHSTMTLFMIDVDCFAKYNDTYGHTAGDTCLKQVADTLSTTFRRCSDFVARYNGERFVILACSMNDKQAQEYANKLRQRIHDMYVAHETSDVSKWLTISVGYASVAPIVGITSDEIVSRAESALYTAKNNGCNRVEKFIRY